MSMFDTVLFKCPKCGHEIDEQIRHEHEQHETYYSDHVPLIVAANIDDVHCGSCNAVYKIKNQHIALELEFDSYYEEENG